MLSDQLIYEMTQTSSIFGRDKDIRVVFEGDSAATDGETIFLPALPYGVDMSREQVEIMRGYVDHEAGHIRHTDMPLVVDFYKRCAADNMNEELKGLHNSIEDIWMEAKVVEVYKGAEKNLKSMSTAIVRKDGWTTSNKDQSLLSKVAMSICSYGRQHYGGKELLEEVGKIPENILKYLPTWMANIKDCKSSEDTITLAKSIYEMLKEDSDKSSDPSESKELGDGDPKDFDPKAGESMEMPEPMDSNGGWTTEGKHISSEELKEFLDQVIARAEEGAELDEEKAGMMEALVENTVSEVKQKAMDYDGSIYTPLTTRFDTVLHKGDKNFTYLDTLPYIETKAKLTGYINVMKSKLRRALMSYDSRDYQGGREEGSLDSKRLVQGYLGSRNVYKTKEDREELSTALTILLDLSGSMDGRKVELTQEAVVAIAESLEGTGISYQIVGFDNPFEFEEDNEDFANVLSDGHSSGNKYHRAAPLRLRVFKGFSDRLHECKPYIGVIEQCADGNNSDRDAILHVTQELKARDENKKVLLVLSDGRPECPSIGYGRYHNNEFTPIEYVSEAIKMVTTDKISPIQCVGIGIMNDSVEKIYPQAVVVNSISELSGSAMQQLSNILLKKR